MYNCSVSVYTNISGLVTVRAGDFKVNSYNATFARLLLGYNSSQLIEKVCILYFKMFTIKIRVHLNF